MQTEVTISIVKQYSIGLGRISLCGHCYYFALETIDLPIKFSVLYQISSNDTPTLANKSSLCYPI